MSFFLILAILQADPPVQPVPLSDIEVTDAFWGARLKAHRTVSLPDALESCGKTHRIRNFEPGAKHEGYPFNDADVYRVIEGAAYVLAAERDSSLEKTVDALIGKIAGGQAEDGYLFTPPAEPWKKMVLYELYCAGHLYEAAVAYHLATGKRHLLDVAIKNADLVCRVFGPGGRRDVPGHPEIGIGLVKLFRATGEERYLETAMFFLEQRGDDTHRRLGGPYSQDHAPLREQAEAVGHAVRGATLYSAIADVAALKGDEDYRRVVERLWEDVVGRKMYVTGGIGARRGVESRRRWRPGRGRT